MTAFSITTMTMSHSPSSSSTPPVVALRDAGPGDAGSVYAWNCATDVRALSGDPRPIAFADHVRWFERRVAAGSFWIVELDGAPVGTVRLDGAAISIALDGSVRGRGVGRRAIAAACGRVAQAGGGAVVAKIHVRNHSSRACFEACGFRPVAERDGFVSYQWSTWSNP